MTESRTSLNKEYNHRHDEYKTNKKEKKNGKIYHCIISEEGELYKYTELSEMSELGSYRWCSEEQINV